MKKPVIVEIRTDGLLTRTIELYRGDVAEVPVEVSFDAFGTHIVKRTIVTVKV